MNTVLNQRHAAAAIAMILLSALVLSMMDAATKHLSSFLSIAFVLWARFSIQAIVMAVWIGKTHGRSGFRTLHPRFQLLRGALLVTASGCAFVGLRYIPLAEFTAIVMLSPILVTAVARVLSHEKVSPLRWVLVCGGFLGTLIVIRPGSGAFGLVAIVPLIGMVVTSAYSLLTSRLARLEQPYTTQFYSGVVGSLLAACLMTLTGAGFSRPWPDSVYLAAALLLFVGLCSSFGHLLLAMAFGRAPAASLMPFTYAQIGFAAILSWLVFHHAPDFWAWVGMSTIAGCGAATAWMNMRAKPAALPPRTGAVAAEQPAAGQTTLLETK